MNPPDSTDADIDALHHLCQRLAGFDERISLEWLDGYLCALLAGPRALAPEEWLPHLAGEAWERTFADPEDVAQATATLMKRWRVIAAQLDPEALLDEPDALRLAPLMMTFSEEERTEMLAETDWKEGDPDPLPRVGELWSHGFLDAVDEFAHDWVEPAPDAEDAEVYANCLEAINALAERDEAALAESLARRYPGETLTHDELIEEACYAAQDLRLYWLDHAPRPAPRHVEATPGRNDPCPCGSGKKFKKCHGAAAA